MTTRTMRASEYSWIAWEMKNLTMEQKRERIMRNAAIIIENAKEAGYEYGSVERLMESICVIMGWMTEPWVGITHAGRKIGRIAPDTDNDKVIKTINHMVAKGAIKLSKSGKGFRLP